MNKENDDDDDDAKRHLFAAWNYTSYKEKKKKNKKPHLSLTELCCSCWFSSHELRHLLHPKDKIYILFYSPKWYEQTKYKKKVHIHTRHLHKFNKTAPAQLDKSFSVLSLSHVHEQRISLNNWYILFIALQRPCDKKLTETTQHKTQ